VGEPDGGGYGRDAAECFADGAGGELVADGFDGADGAGDRLHYGADEGDGAEEV
jgi:hypothetical protein